MPSLSTRSTLTAVALPMVLWACTAPGESGEPADRFGRETEALVTPVCVTEQRTGASGVVYDTQLSGSSTDATGNRGSMPVMNVGTLSGTPRQSLVRVDLPVLPAGASFVSAALTVTPWWADNPPAQMTAHNVLVPWSESVVDWATFYPVGGAQPYVSAVAASTTTVAGKPITFNLTTLATGWYAGTTPNYGVLLMQAGGANAILNSSEDATVALRPSWSICYLPAPTCTDGVRNGTETSVDCGGGTCPACATGLGCIAASDCQGGVCQGGVCAAPTCTDGVRNGTETDVDCGGSACAACGTSDGCATATDCQSGVCSGSTCAAPTCTDGVRNGSETGVDCGGSACDATGQACTASQPCNVAADCLSGTCSGGRCGFVLAQVDAGGVFGATDTTDGGQNGGDYSPPPDGTIYYLGAVGTACDDVTTFCASRNCVNGVCAPGAVGALCTVTSDCQAPEGCDVTTKLCDPTMCNDGVKDGTETDVDCGGGTCPACVPGRACANPGDCVTGRCSDGHICGAFGLNHTCAAPSDCQTGNCEGGTCQPVDVQGTACSFPAYSSVLSSQQATLFENQIYSNDGTTGYLDVLSPNDGQNHPLVVFFHGGEWIAGHRNAGVHLDMTETFTALNWVTATVDYRLAQAVAAGNDGTPYGAGTGTALVGGQSAAFSPAAEIDSRCAIRFLKNSITNGNPYHIAPGMMIAAGSSAGAHLAALIATDPDDPAFDDGNCPYSGSASVNGAILHSGIYDLGYNNVANTMPDSTHLYSGTVTTFLGYGSDYTQLKNNPTCAKAAGQASPVTYLTPGASVPPLLLLHGGSDPLINEVNATNMQTDAAVAGVAATVVIEAGLQHQYDWWDAAPASARAAPVTQCTVQQFLASIRP